MLVCPAYLPILGIGIVIHVDIHTCTPKEVVYLRNSVKINILFVELLLIYKDDKKMYQVEKREENNCVPIARM